MYRGLINQGYPVKQVFSADEFRLIEGLMKQGKIAHQKYGKLEEMVAE